MKNLRTWVEIDSRAARKNYDIFRRLIGKDTKLWAVVKSNAYGHGLFAFSTLMDRFGIDGFCVDSIVEGIALRKAGIKKPILVLGSTLSSRYGEAAKYDITICISTIDSLRALLRARPVPRFHLKIDTGMHRQGFYVDDLSRVVRLLKNAPPKIKSRLTGIATHFASAKDSSYPSYTEMQFAQFQNAIALFEDAGFSNLTKHAAATGGTLMNSNYHLDAVRIGIGLYGLWPSKELEIQLSDTVKLQPVLSWRTVVSETKRLKAGEYVGYDLTERMPNDITMAVVPIGYWHGFPRSLSSGGQVLVRGARARVLGRVSMDMIVIGLPPGSAVREGAIVTIIGRDHKERIFAWEPSQQAGTSHYEFLTRLNPLMERIII